MNIRSKNPREKHTSVFRASGTVVSTSRSTRSQVGVSMSTEIRKDKDADIGKKTGGNCREGKVSMSPLGSPAKFEVRIVLVGAP
jgi:hypothetical protein